MPDVESSEVTDEHRAGSAPIVLTIPSHDACAPARANRVGGVARVHPSWTAFSSQPSIASAPVLHWGPGKVASVTTRSAVTFHRRSGSFQALSVKMGREISGIGPYEQMKAEDLEVDHETVEYDLQGFRISWEDGTTYLADFHALHVTRGIVAGEVKADRSYFLHPGYKPTMANAARTCAAVGIRFEEVDGTTMSGEFVRRRNVRRAYSDRFTTVTEDQEEAIRNLLATNGEVTLHRIRSILANDHRTAQQMVHALLCRRIIAYDLDRPVNNDTIVFTPAAPAAWPDIRRIDQTEEV